MNNILEGLETKEVYFLSCQKKVPRSESIPTTDEILEKNKEGKVVKRKIRYMPDEQSIYADEQSEIANNKFSQIIMRDGFIPVSPMEVNLLEYLRKSNYNINNPFRDKNKQAIFYENVPGKKAEEFVISDKSKTEAKYLIHNLDADNIELISYALGENKNISSKMTSDLRRDLLVKAEVNPTVIIDMCKNIVDTEISALIFKALDLGIIKSDTFSISLDSGQILFRSEYGQDVKESFKSFLKSDQGKKIYDVIYSRVNPFSKKVYAENFVKTEPILVKNEEDPLVGMINKAFEIGVLYKSGEDIMMKSAPKHILVGTDVDSLLSIFKMDESLYSKLESKLNRSK